jgi:hypothetical protein
MRSIGRGREPGVNRESCGAFRFTAKIQEKTMIHHRGTEIIERKPATQRHFNAKKQRSQRIAKIREMRSAAFLSLPDASALRVPSHLGAFALRFFEAVKILKVSSTENSEATCKMTREIAFSRFVSQCSLCLCGEISF